MLLNPNKSIHHIKDCPEILEITVNRLENANYEIDNKLIMNSGPLIVKCKIPFDNLTDFDEINYLAKKVLVYKIYNMVNNVGFLYPFDGGFSICNNIPPDYIIDFIEPQKCENGFCTKN
jgi:hypothetical protein